MDKLARGKDSEFLFTEAKSFFVHRGRREEWLGREKTPPPDYLVRSSHLQKLINYVDIVHVADDAADEDYMFLVLMLFCLVLMVLMVLMVSLMLLMQDVQPEKKEKQLSWWRRLLNMLTKGKKSVRRTAREQNRLEYL